MIFNMLKGDLCKAGVILITGMLIGISSMAYSADAPATKDAGDWKKVVEAAKKEGKLLMAGDPTEVWRKAMVDMFQQEYPEIKVKYIGITGRNFLPRIKQERAMGQKLWAVLSAGTTSGIDLKKEGFIVPVRQLLLPEIADDAKWIGGLDSIFYDKEKRYLPCYSIAIQPTAFANRDFIKEGELKSSAQLLDPIFKGKMVMQTPTVRATFSALSNLTFMYGEIFLRELLSKQNVIVTDDNRQQTEWVVRGKYPIAIGLANGSLVPFEKQGLGKNVKMLEDKIIPVGTGGSGIFLITDAPHPNAAKVYINWVLSQKAQAKLSKDVFLNSRRTDVPPVDKETAINPAHIDNYRHFSTEENLEIAMRLVPIIKESLKQ